MKNKTEPFVGTYTAIITPLRFIAGKIKPVIDDEALKRIVEAQVAAGVDGIVVTGTTGGASMLSAAEQIRVIELCVEYARGRIEVIGGTGANATDEAIHLTQSAEEAGADGTLQVEPYYVRPNQEGMFQHFRAIAQSTALRVMLYSVPKRTGVQLGVETVHRLALECPNVVSMKEAGGDVGRVAPLIQALGPGRTVLSGDDELTLPFMKEGARGVVSVASGVIPLPVTTMVRLMASGKTAEAQALHEQYLALFKALFIEPNPQPAHAALAMTMGIEEALRSPYVPMQPDTREKLRQVLVSCGVLKV